MGETVVGGLFVDHKDKYDFYINQVLIRSIIIDKKDQDEEKAQL
jgi:hypothetical protein